MQTRATSYSQLEKHQTKSNEMEKLALEPCAQESYREKKVLTYHKTEQTYYPTGSHVAPPNTKDYYALKSQQPFTL